MGKIVIAKKVFWLFVVAQLIGLGLINQATTVYGSGPGTTAASFLKIGVGARPVSMGESFSAVADDVYAVHYNPAGLAQVKRIQVGLTHNVWLEKINHDFAGLVLPLGKVGSLGFSAVYVSMDKLKGYDVIDDGNYTPIETEDFTANDLAAIFTYAGNIAKWGNAAFSLGINLKSISQQIEKEKTSAFTGDIGLLLGDPSFRLAVVLQNFDPTGKGIKFIKEENPLPTNLKAGVSLSLFKGFTLSGEYNQPLDKELKPIKGRAKINAGVEMVAGGIFAIRGGYTTLKDIGPKISAGLGLKIFFLNLDYAFVPFGDLGNTHRLSVTLKL